MDRRSILKYSAVATAAVVASPLASSLLSGCNVDKMAVGSPEGLHFFSKDEFQLLGKLIDVILPKTDSPSATEVGVDFIIDNMVGTVYKTESRVEYRNRFNALQDHLKENPDVNAAVNLLHSSEDLDIVEAKKSFLEIKQQTIAYYLSTETIGKNFLNYLPVPGEYKSCISLEEAGNKAWAI